MASCARSRHGSCASIGGRDTLQTTALVHDVFLRMLDRAPSDFSSTAHLLHAAGRMMRQILVDRMRNPDVSRRSTLQRDNFTRLMQLPIPEDVGIIDLDQALNELEQFDPRMAQIVELRYFVGLGTQEISRAIGISGRTVQRDWLLAQAWLRERLSA